MIANPPPEPPPLPPPHPRTRLWRRPRLSRKINRRREARRGTQCLNCDTPTTAKYCPECGQENVDVKISLVEIFKEAYDEFVRIDSKFLRTLAPLFARPGFLTLEWSRGRRTKYISPLRLYLLITAVFFLFCSVLHVNTFMNKKAEAISPDALHISQTEPGLFGFINLQIRRMSAVSGPRLNDAFYSELPTAIFIMLPLFAGVLWFLYIRSRRYYVEHIVFALHCHSFYFLVLLIALPMPSSLWWLFPKLGLALWVPIYSLLALRRVYGQGWIKTIVKAGILGYLYTILLGLTIAASVLFALTSISDDELVKAPTTPVKSASKATKESSSGTHGTTGGAVGR
ncbi:DUF3667 domain-containing protein [Fimbriimonas ginsengisoli]|uniref:DUF3667 domain-containing protein n=1 Tax=Fimbriimonas ginsengisoli Gsoil 348 TaxID=661478 RepID=A0A068NYV5_FIMGI|nr:DUF3667 domain-containing protein [Fimbriimonas ginsengisoli]AIE87484.1 hypothetical protein OP10G_4116 [Fimbriimonas ginsengisoli Gsoil 348]